MSDKEVKIETIQDVSVEPVEDVYNNQDVVNTDVQSVTLDPSVRNLNDNTSVTKVPADNIWKSGNYVANTSGWIIKGNGDVEFGSGHFRGDITGATGTFTGAISASSLDIPDAVTADSFHVDSNGNAWWGSNALGTAVAKILNTGEAVFKGVTTVGSASDAFNQISWNSTTLGVNGSYVTNNDIYGDGSDGDVTINVDTTLTSDMFYNNLTINNGKKFTTNGYRVFVKYILTNNGTLSFVGYDGTDGSDYNTGNAGAGGTALSSGSLYGSIVGASGGVGAQGGIPACNRNGGSGVAGTNTDKSVGSAGVTGGAGNGGGRVAQCTIGSGGTGGTITGTIYNKVKTVYSAYLMADVLPSLTVFKPCPASGGGGGGGAGKNGANTAFSNGGGGGGAGSSGGLMSIFARKITGTGTITVKGGNGGKGGDGTPFNAGLDIWGGGGGGGAGGNGGVIVLVYSAIDAGQTTVVTGGTGGTGGNDGNGSPATSGSNGANGLLISLQV